jgi:hypothetical protein
VDFAAVLRVVVAVGVAVVAIDGGADAAGARGRAVRRVARLLALTAVVRVAGGVGLAAVGRGVVAVLEAVQAVVEGARAADAHGDGALEVARRAAVRIGAAEVDAVLADAVAVARLLVRGADDLDVLAAVVTDIRVGAGVDVGLVRVGADGGVGDVRVVPADARVGAAVLEGWSDFEIAQDAGATHHRAGQHQHREYERNPSSAAQHHGRHPF